MVISIGKQYTNGLKSSNGGICLTLVHTFDLSVALGEETCFVANYLSIFILLVAKHPFGTDDVVVVVGLLDQCLHLISLKVV